jgi:hypothetical protein
MAFTRENLAAMEKPAAIEPAPVTAEVTETQPSESVKATAEETSTPASAEPAETDSDGSQDVTAESSPATADPDSESPTEAADGTPQRSSAQERIAELVIERNAMRKYGDYLLNQVRELQGKGPAKGSAPEVPQVSDANDPAPTLEAHQYDPVAYSTAQAAWVQRQINKGVAQAVQQLETLREVQTLRQNFQQKVNEFKKVHSDFDVVIGNPELPPMSENTARLIINSDVGPAITYHLATNPDVAERISKMPPERQAMAIGRLEVQLATPPAPVKPAVKRTVTQAPPPPKPVATSSAPVRGEPQSMDEFVAREREQKLAEKEMRRKMRLAMR